MRAVGLGLLVLVFSTTALAGIEDLGLATCGPLNNSFGPLDYRTATEEHHRMVEGAHFLSYIESLKRGKNAVTPGPDIDYTLRVFPNHHRALLAMMNLSFKENRNPPIGSSFKIECWMERGERWRPDDEIVKLLFGTYLLKVGRRDEARVKLEAADRLISGKDDYIASPNMLYNLGLAFFRLGDKERALAYAHKAYAQNYPLPGLREMLKKAGQWQDAKPALTAPQRSDASGPQ